ncbi:hypothetical protein SAMN04489761_2062 [Tenacibaculum sp. MAR_2009_124]|nr:hypothetical protein SAMN04489761_2062 [Tenacibaculum sp. MAR_2009_124]
MNIIENETQKRTTIMWLGLNTLIKKYLTQIKEAIENGDLSKRKYLFTIREYLMHKDKPKIYSSQVNEKKYKILKL